MLQSKRERATALRVDVSHVALVKQQQNQVLCVRVARFLLLPQSALGFISMCPSACNWMFFSMLLIFVYPLSACQAHESHIRVALGNNKPGLWASAGTKCQQ